MLASLLTAAALLIGVAAYLIYRCYVITPKTGFKDCDGMLHGMVSSLKKGKKFAEVTVSIFLGMSPGGGIVHAREFKVYFPNGMKLPEENTAISLHVAMRTYPLRKFFDKYALWSKQWEQIGMLEIPQQLVSSRRIESLGQEVMYVEPQPQLIIFMEDGIILLF